MEKYLSSLIGVVPVSMVGVLRQIPLIKGECKICHSEGVFTRYETL